MEKEHFRHLLERYKNTSSPSPEISEIGDGNINYVYRVKDRNQSIIVKR